MLSQALRHIFVLLDRNLSVATLDAPRDPDYYDLLSVHPTAAMSEIRIAYHRALLRFHPDKHRIATGDSQAPAVQDVDVDLLKRAYTTLSSVDLRKKYDSSRSSAPIDPRPAQVVSLEEFSETEDVSEESVWTYGCRCGGHYVIKESDMEHGQHLVGCSSCSEVVWVGYELARTDG